MTDDDAVVKVYTLNDPNQAEIIKNMLRDHGIDCVLDGEGQAGFTGVLEIDVLVKANDAEQATEVLKSHHVDDSLEEE
jgi:hypothetical protein